MLWSWWWWGFFLCTFSIVTLNAEGPLAPFLPSLTKYHADLVALDAPISCQLPEKASTGIAITFSCQIPLPRRKATGVYVTLESKDAVHGAFSSTSASDTHFSFRVMFSLSGVYHMAFDYILPDGHVPLSSYRNKSILVEGKTLIVPLDSATPCVSSLMTSSSQGEEDNVDDIDEATATKGTWLKCNNRTRRFVSPTNCFRWGYAFRPRHCYYDNWSQREIDRIAKSTLVGDNAASARDNKPKHSILILGSSIQRGIFFSAVDHLLRYHEWRGFVRARKCWGRLRVTVGAITLTYVDFRGPILASLPPKTPQNNVIECHGNAVGVNEYELQRNSSAAVADIFASEHAPTTVVILSHMKPSATFTSDFARILASYVSVPPEWKGNIVMPLLRTPLHNDFDPKDEPVVSRAAALDFSDDFGRDVVVVDGMDIQMPFLRYKESLAGSLTQHWHNVVDGHYNETNRLHLDPKKRLMHVEGIVVDAFAQIIFNIEFGPKNQEQQLHLNDNNNINYIKKKNPIDDGEEEGEDEEEEERSSYLPFQLCMDCRPSLLPITVTPKNEMKCNNFVRTAKTSPVQYPVPCPPACLLLPVAHVITTNTGEIPVRRCEVSAL